MINKLKTITFEQVSFYSILVFALTLPLSGAAISFFIFWFLLLVIVKKGYKNSFDILKENKIFIYLGILFIYIFLSALWSDDTQNMLRHLRLYGYWIMIPCLVIPILKYQSEEFDIMGNLKKHFEEDILFTNIISEGDGTIASLEALLLNIPYRPNSFPFSQSDYAQTSFTFTPAFLYNNEGYNTSFIYGGDSTWRDLGKFVKYQGYQVVEGKQDIFSSIKVTKEESEYFHPWGIYDEYLYEHILNKLEKSNGKEMIVALSTNNHPPYNIPNGYKSKILSYSEDLRNHITGDFALAEQRLKSYGYALDSIGTFLDKFKKSKFKDNTIVVITADNNTIEGIMKYDDNPIFTSKNIPIYFYLPKELKDRLEIDTSVAGSQKDIFPTLYNLTLKDTKYLSIGNNLFDKIYPHFGFNGSMIVNKENEVRKLNNLKETSEDELVNYYKASLAITEYLINNYKKKE